jgi:hypothetical protein
MTDEQERALNGLEELRATIRGTTKIMSQLFDSSAILNLHDASSLIDGGLGALTECSNIAQPYSYSLTELLEHVDRGVAQDCNQQLCRGPASLSGETIIESGARVRMVQARK